MSIRSKYKKRIARTSKAAKAIKALNDIKAISGKYFNDPNMIKIHKITIESSVTKFR